MIRNVTFLQHPVSVIEFIHILSIANIQAWITLKEWSSKTKLNIPLEHYVTIICKLMTTKSYTFAISNIELTEGCINSFFIFQYYNYTTIRMYSFIYDVWFVITYEGSKIDDIHPKQLSQGFYGLKRPKKGLYISGHHILHLVRSCITSKNNQKLLYWAHATDFKSFWAADNIKYQLNFLRERYFRITISKLISLAASNIF